MVKASELVPVAYFPVEIRCEFSWEDHSTTRHHWPKWDSRPCTAKVQAPHEYWNLYVTMLWLDHVCAGAVKFPKSWLWTLLCQQKIHHFFFSQTWGACFKYLPEGCPYMLMYSALHIVQWFSQILVVFTLKIRRKFFEFNIFMNQSKCRLHKTWSDR